MLNSIWLAIEEIYYIISFTLIISYNTLYDVQVSNVNVIRI